MAGSRARPDCSASRPRPSSVAPDLRKIGERFAKPYVSSALGAVADTWLPLEWSAQRAALGFPAKAVVP
jgi:hypothetical protein